MNKNIYYLASSAAQKCVRRGEAEAAVNFARVMWELDKFATWKRIWIWLSEDCCRNTKALKLFHGWTESSKLFEPMIPLIQAMAEGPKDRTGASLSAIIRMDQTSPVRIWTHLKDQPIHKRVIDLMKDWGDRYFECYDVWDYDIGDNNYDWVIEVCERGSKYDREHFIVAIPYFFMKDTRDTIDKCVVECGPPTWYDNWFPLEAMDGHTRPGQSAFGVYCKHRKFPKIGVTSGYGLKPYVFFNEGWLATQYCPYSYNFINLWMDGVSKDTPQKVMSGYFNPEVRTYMQEEVLPELNNVRIWAIEKMFKEDFGLFKELYQKDFIKI